MSFCFSPRKEDTITSDAETTTVGHLQIDVASVPDGSLFRSEDSDDEYLTAVIERALNRENQQTLSSPFSPKSVPSLLSPTSAKVGKNYDEGATSLYSRLEKKSWEDVRQIIQKDPSEAAIWIFRNEKNSSKLRWRLLPIHAAIIFKAPEDIIEELLTAHPDGAISVDDQGMVPLHLAFRHMASDATLYTLVKACPAAIDVKDRKGRRPIELHHSLYSTKKVLPAAKTSGIELYVSTAIQREKDEVMSQLTDEFNCKLKEVNEQHDNELKSTVGNYEDEIAKIRSEMDEKIALDSKNYQEAIAIAEEKMNQLEQDTKTARLASESLIYRFDIKCNAEKELKLALIEMDTQIKELTEMRNHSEEKVKDLTTKIEGLEQNLNDEVISHSHDVEELSSKLKATEASLTLQVTELNDTLALLRADYSKQVEELKDLIADRESKLKEQQEGNQLLEESNIKLADTVQEKEDTLSELETQINHFQSLVEAKDQQVSFLQEHNEMLENLNKDLNEKLVKMGQTTEKLDETERKLSDLRWEKEVLESAVEEYKSVIEITKSANSGLQSDIEAATLKLAEETASLRGLSSENEALKSSVNDLKALIEKLESSCAVYEISLKDARERVLELEFREKEITSEKIELENAVVEMKALIEQLQAFKEDETRKVIELEVRIADYDNLQAYSKELKETVERLQTSNAEYQDLLEAANKRVLEQEANIHISQSEREDAMSLYQTKSAIVDKLQLSVEEYETKLSESKLMLAEKMDEILRIKASTEYLVESYQNKCTAETALQERISETEKELAELQKTFVSEKSNAESVITNLEQTNHELNMKLGDLAIKVAKLPELNEKMEAAERRLANVTEMSKIQKAALEQSVDALQQLNGELSTNVITLEMQLKEVTEKLEDSERFYSQQNQELLEETSIMSTKSALSSDKVVILERITSKLQSKVSALELSKAQLEEAAKERDILRVQVVSLQKCLDDELKEKEEMRNDLKKIKEEKSELENYVQTLDDSQVKEMAALRKEVEELKDSRDASLLLFQELESVKDINIELNSQIQALEQKNSYITMRLRHLSSSDVPEKQFASDELRQRMMETVEKRMRQVKEKSYIDRVKLFDFTKKSKKFEADERQEKTLAAIKMLQTSTINNSPDERDEKTMQRY